MHIRTDIKNILAYGIVFGAIMFFYAPVFGPNFAYLNDYTAFMPMPFGFPESFRLFQIGRPVQAILVNMQFRFLGDMLSLQIMRILIVLVIAALAALFFRYVKNNIKINMGSAVLLSLLMFTLPSMTINSFFIAQSVPGIVPVLFALFAHAWMRKSKLAAFILLFLGLCVYTPTTFFFLTLTFVAFIFGPKDPNRAKLKDIYNEVMVLLAASVVYFLCVKFIIKPLTVGLVVEAGAHAFALSVNPFSKLASIIDLFVLDFSAWFPPLQWFFLIPLIAIFILVITWASFVSPYLSHLRNSSKIIVGVALALLIPIVTAAPVLVIQGDYPILYRLLFPSMAATVPIAMVFIIDRVILVEKRNLAFFPVLVGISVFIVFAISASHHRLVLEVTRLSAEYQHVFDVVTRANKEKDIRIPPFHFTSPQAAEHPRYLYKDFGYTSVDSSPEAMVRAVMQSLDAAKRLNPEREIWNRTVDCFHIAYDPLGPRYTAVISDVLFFGREGYPSFISSYKGFAGREEWGRWTDSEKAIIEFVKPLPRKFTLKIRAGASPVWIGKPVKIIIGNTQLTATFNSQKMTEVALNVTTDGKAKSIAFQFPNIKSQKELGLGADPRHLGLGLVEMQIIVP